MRGRTAAIWSGFTILWRFRRETAGEQTRKAEVYLGHYRLRAGLLRVDAAAVDVIDIATIGVMFGPINVIASQRVARMRAR